MSFLKAMLRVLVVFCLSLAPAPAFASDKDPILTAWYQALERVDFEALRAASIDDRFAPFIFRVKDTDIKQDRATFFASLEQRKLAGRAVSIDYKITDFYEGGLFARTCYRLANSELLAEEHFFLSGTQIQVVEQTRKADSCASF